MEGKKWDDLLADELEYKFKWPKEKARETADEMRALRARETFNVEYLAAALQLREKLRAKTRAGSPKTASPKGAEENQALIDSILKEMHKNKELARNDDTRRRERITVASYYLVLRDLSQIAKPEVETAEEYSRSVSSLDISEEEMAEEPLF